MFFFFKVSFTLHSRINSEKYPTLNSGNVSEPKLMSPVWRVREVVCA